MPPPKANPRAEFRQQENLRITASSTLAEKYHDLKSLMVELAYFQSDGIRQATEIKYTVNLAHAQSAFSVNCRNDECVGGDFDLTEKLAGAVAAREISTSGEVCCQGWQDRTTIESERCHTILRYKLNLEYAGHAALEAARQK